MAVAQKTLHYSRHKPRSRGRFLQVTEMMFSHTGKYVAAKWVLMGKFWGNIANILPVMLAPKAKKANVWVLSSVVASNSRGPDFGPKNFISLLRNLCCGANICSWVKALVGRGLGDCKTEGATRKHDFPTCWPYCYLPVLLNQIIFSPYSLSNIDCIILSWCNKDLLYTLHTHLGHCFILAWCSSSRNQFCSLMNCMLVLACVYHSIT